MNSSAKSYHTHLRRVDGVLPDADPIPLADCPHYHTLLRRVDGAHTSSTSSSPSSSSSPASSASSTSSTYSSSTPSSSPSSASLRHRLRHLRLRRMGNHTFIFIIVCVGHLHHRTWLVGAPECVQVASAGGHTGVCVDDRHRMWLVGAPECVSVTCILGLGWRVRIIGLDWSAHWSTCWRPSSDVAGGRTATRVCDLHHRTQLVGAPECASVNIIGRAHTFTDRAPTGRLCTFLD